MKVFKRPTKNSNKGSGQSGPSRPNLGDPNAKIKTVPRVKPLPKTVGK
jgi:hypothetical protein